MPSHCAGTSLVLGNCAPHVEKRQQPNCHCYSHIKNKKIKIKSFNSEKKERGNNCTWKTKKTGSDKSRILFLRVVINEFKLKKMNILVSNFTIRYC